MKASGVRLVGESPTIRSLFALKGPLMNNGFFSNLTLLLIGLKFTGYCDVSWAMVLLPLWGPLSYIFLRQVAIEYRERSKGEAGHPDSSRHLGVGK